MAERDPLIKRAALAALAIILMTAGAVSAAGLLELDRIKDLIPREGVLGSDVKTDTPDPGRPQTIMILGTDGRLGADAGGGQRSDTILLARMDSGNRAITLTSIPRDLSVAIPGYGTDKINAAYSLGGAALTLKTVKDLMAQAGDPFKVNHVIEVNFTGFREMIDYLGCTFVDVDRHYFNDVGGPLGYATIDVDRGYQKLCGADALDYVRYRHADGDLLRAARQQDFVRQTLRQPDVQRRLTFSRRTELVKLAGRFVRMDKGLARSSKQILSLLKLGLGVADKPIQQVPFGAGQLTASADQGSLYASPAAIKDTVSRFLDPKARRQRKKKVEVGAEGLVNTETLGQAQARMAPNDIGLRLYYPKLGEAHGIYEGEAPRVYKVHGQPAYRMSVRLSNKTGAYYGIQGMKWTKPPILLGPHDDVVVDRRKLSVYRDGSKVRLVAWRTTNAIYYVHNTLGRDLSKAQLLAILRSFTILPSN